MAESLRFKIDQLSPSSVDFELLFQICEIISFDNDTLKCRIVDDTGIVNASFNRFGKRMQIGHVYIMTNLKSCLLNGFLHIQMTQQTTVTRQPEKIAFKDKVNDISKKKFSVSKNTQVLAQETTNKTASVSNISAITSNAGSHTAKEDTELITKKQVLIPFSKEEAIQQLRLQKQFVKKVGYPQNLKQGKSHEKFNRDRDFKQQRRQSKINQKNQSIKGKGKGDNAQYKQDRQQKGRQKGRFAYEPKKQDKQYKQKNTEARVGQQQKDIRNNYQPKNTNTNKWQDRNTKTKSLYFKPKETALDERAKDRESQKYQQSRYLQKDQVYQQKDHKPRKNNVIYRQKELKENKDSKQAHGKEDIQQKHSQEEKTKENSQGLVPQKYEALTQKQRQSSIQQIISILDNKEKSISVKVYICQESRVVDNEYKQILIADKSGSVWLRLASNSKIRLDPREFYEIDNLQVCYDNKKIYLKQSDISQAKQLIEPQQKITPNHNLVHPENENEKVEV